MFDDRKPAPKPALSLATPSWTLLTSITLLLTTASCSQEIARVKVGDEPSELQFTAPAGEEPELWVEATLISKDSTNKDISQLPHLIDLEIEILREGQRVANLSCNPFNVHIFSDYPAKGFEKRHYQAKLDSCSWKHEPGAPTTVRVRKKIVRGGPQHRLKKISLIVKI